MGAGVAKALYKYPQVKEKFHHLATQPDYNTPTKQLWFGTTCENQWPTSGSEQFSQLHYGRKQGVVYTNYQALLTNLSKLDAYAKT